MSRVYREGNLLTCYDCGWKVLLSEGKEEPEHLCPDDCPTCKGRGRIGGASVRETEAARKGVRVVRRECPDCAGTGKRRNTA
jgi:DnaJ-class molecular chaperone